VNQALQFDPAPLVLEQVSIRPEWLNASGHLRAAHYIMLFDRAIEAFLERTGLSAPNAKAAPFLLEMHTCYQKELREGDEVRIDVHALGATEKRVHFIMAMRTADNEVAATTELAIANVALSTRRTEPWTPGQRTALAALVQAHAKLPIPPQAGRAIARPNR
jgi:acyl-CoA thioester hydrolase